MREGMCTWREEQTSTRQNAPSASCNLASSRSASALERVRLSNEPCALATVCIRYVVPKRGVMWQHMHDYCCATGKKNAMGTGRSQGLAS